MDSPDKAAVRTTIQVVVRSEQQGAMQALGLLLAEVDAGSFLDDRRVKTVVVKIELWHQDGSGL